MSIATSVGHLRYPPPPAIVFTRPESSQDLPLVPTPQTVGRNRSDRPELGNIRRFIQGWFMPEGHSLEGGVSFPVQPLANWVQSEFATPLSAAATELPCTIKIKVWQHDIGDPFALMKSDTCLEMGAHFSPCGRYLAACVACVVPHAEIDPGLQTLAQQDSGLATSPTQHPLTAHQVIYELRVYSLQKESFGSVLVSREIRAANCLTSIQFSPTSEHIMLAYGRHHAYLSNSIVTDGEATSHFFRVLEIYRVSDMELVRVLPSSEDEVNVACFHPSPGCGLVYGTKEGSLRIFQYNTAATSNFTGPNTYPDENLSEFSPTSEHIMLAYGRHHAYLSNSIVTDGEATSHFFRVLEIYRVSDMELVRVLPSSEDEVNVACFHPSPGCGLVYGTKEGSLRIFQYNTAATSNFTGPNTYPDENLSEIYRVSDMELVRVLPSSEDEVNVACFHPSPGCGLVYGTKEGSLRIFQYNTAATSNFTGPNTYPDENLSEVA
ncbi:hypothetical protein F2Q69_00041535 [Brassica cretica]|uniref:Uncharacterized protein n=1 Tax=Brassica cretica TaxID=69181 RepID=A0A8S9NDR4_BRACR|nr:hypothetical protein F2Q69_00041535 [Brassica cretica]